MPKSIHIDDISTDDEQLVETSVYNNKEYSIANLLLMLRSSNLNHEQLEDLHVAVHKLSVEAARKHAKKHNKAVERRLQQKINDNTYHLTTAMQSILSSHQTMTAELQNMRKEFKDMKAKLPGKEGR